MEEIYVLTLKRQNLSTSQMAPGAEKDGEPETLRHALHDCCHFSDRRHGAFGRSHLAGALDLTGALQEQSIGDGRIDYRPQHPIRIISRHRMFSIKRQVPTSHCARSKPSQLNVPNLRNHVQPEPPRVS
jgi:hypothetical protein